MEIESDVWNRIECNNMRVLKKEKSIKGICNRLEKQEEKIRILDQKRILVRNNQKIKKGRGFFLARLEFF